MSESAEEKHELKDRIDGAPSSDLKEDANGSIEAGKSSKLDKVLNRLQGHGSAEHSRESSPDPSVKDSGSGRSSRRKPKVTRKVVDDENPTQETSQDDDVVDDAMNLAIQEFLNSSSMDKVEEPSEQSETTDKEKASEEKQEAIDVDEHGNLILPEGTVVVEPEAVTDSKPIFKGPEFRSSDSPFRKTKNEIDLNLVHCTACNHQINTNSIANVKRHPVLKVILCKRCYSWYTSDEIIQDKDGMDEQCRWCGDGGDLLCCDFCHNAFCKACIRRNLGRGELSELLSAGEDSKWHCYVCDPKPLAELIYNCNQIIEAVEQREKRLREREFRKDEHGKKKRSPPEPTRQSARRSSRSATPVISRQMNPHRSQTVMNLLKTAQQNVGQKQPHPVGVIKAVSQAQKGIQQMPIKSGLHLPGQVATNNTFIEWNFRINENNVMPIIDRAMMVTESMHMLLSSLRDDVQKASTASPSQRTLIKGESAGKLRRALTAFNKSFFDLGMFSQKTSTPVTVRKMIDEQAKFAQQRGAQQPIRPMQLVQHGQQLVMLPSGATVVQPSKQVQQKQVMVKKTVTRSKPVSSGEVIELLDSDDESKLKGQRNQAAAADSSAHNTDRKTRGAMGGPGRKLKGPLAKRRRLKELEARREQRARERQEKEDKNSGGSDEDQMSTRDKSEETDKDKGMDDDEAARVAAEEKDASEEPQKEGDEMNVSSDHDDSKARKSDEDASLPTSHSNDEESNHAADLGSDGGEMAEVGDKQDRVMEDSDKHGQDKELEAIDDLENFKNIEEQLKQLNGSMEEPAKSSSKMDVGGKHYEDAHGRPSDEEQVSNCHSVSDSDNIAQLDGAHDSFDSSSNSSSPESHSEALPRKPLSRYAATLKSEPLLNLDSMSSTDNSEDSNSDGFIGFGLNEDDSTDAEEFSSSTELKNSEVERPPASLRTRDDIEAQRELHLELLEETNEDEDEDSLETSDSENVSDAKELSDEYCPTVKTVTQKKQSNLKRTKGQPRKRHKSESRTAHRKHSAAEKNKKNRHNSDENCVDNDHSGLKGSGSEDGVRNKKAQSPRKWTDPKQESSEEDDKQESKRSGRKRNLKISAKDDITEDSETGADKTVGTSETVAELADAEPLKDDKYSKKAKKRLEKKVVDGSNLDDEIKMLSRKPVLSKKKKKHSSNENGEEQIPSDGDEKQEKQTTTKLKISIKGKSVSDLVAELSSGDDNEEDAVEEESDEQASASEEDAAMKETLAPDSGDEEASAMRALLEDDSSSDGTDDEFGIEEKVPKKKKKCDDENGSAIIDEEDYDSDDIVTPRKKLPRTALLNAKLLDSDSNTSENENSTSSDKKSETKRKKGEENDSVEEGNKKVKKKRKKKDSTSSESDASSDEETNKKKSKKRRRVKFQSESSAGEEDNSSQNDENDTPGKKKKKIRKIIKDKKLSEETKSASQAEEARRQRVKERQKLYNFVEQEDDITSPTKCPVITKLVLEVDKDKKPVIEVDRDLIRKLKPHQVEAVQFMWDCVAETTERLQNDPGSGCILAHCMGLGKTLSVITLVSTLLAHKEITKINTCLVVCPLNTILNWQTEFEKWLPENNAVEVWQMSHLKDNYSRTDALRDWHESGGVMIIGYDMYRNLSTQKNVRKKKLVKILTETLVDPGPDIVVCDEGHVLKNDSSALSKAMNRIKTQRRIVLTGTPLQNNLIEYHCMVDFIKPKLLGTRKEFTNRFVNPINSGQCSDASSYDVKLMKRRAHILHETLAGCIQRRDYSALTKYLMPKYEYIISVRLSPVQIELYRKYLDLYVDKVRNEEGHIVNRNASLFADYNNLMKIWTHPWTLKLDEIRQEQKTLWNDDSESSFIDDASSEASESEESSSSDSSPDSDSKPGGSKTKHKQNDKDSKEPGRRIRTRAGGEDPNKVSSAEEDVVSKDWWGEYVSEEDHYKTEISGKLMVLAEIIKMCDSIGDKLLVFSKSLLSLDLIEDFLQYWDQNTDPKSQMAGTGSWVPGLDYYRMDGSTSAQTRKSTVACFNDADNTRMRLFLISTRAGCLGINLVSANRVIVFDASWNPTHDVQSIFRVFRFGQTKPVYVYRLLAQGTMEEKIYERQVTKQSLSQRVVDEHQIERHFSSADLQELYTFKPDRLDDPDREEPPVPKLPKDRLLAELLTNCKDWIYNYHEHDSLLENREDENLTEEEKKAAWEEYEAEKQGLIRRTAQHGIPANMNPMYSQYGMMAMPQAADVQNIAPEAEQIARAIYASNPGISEEMLKERVHAYLQQRLEQYRLFMLHQEEQRRMQQEIMKLQQMRTDRQRQQEYLAGRYSAMQLGNQNATDRGNKAENADTMRSAAQTLNDRK